MPQILPPTQPPLPLPNLAAMTAPPPPWARSAHSPSSPSPSQLLQSDYYRRRSADQYRPTPLPTTKPTEPAAENNTHLLDFMRQSRAALESQRLSFEKERASFAEERRLWEREAELLKGKVADLEREVESLRRASGASSSACCDSVRVGGAGGATTATATATANGVATTADAAMAMAAARRLASLSPPLSEEEGKSINTTLQLPAQQQQQQQQQQHLPSRGVTSAPPQLQSQSQSQSQSLPQRQPSAPPNPPIWQGTSPPGKPTRTFNGTHFAPTSATTRANGSGSGIASPAPNSLDKALSPRAAHVRVPVELLDSSLDGIMLKSTALPPDVVARVASPAGSSGSGSLQGVRRQSPLGGGGEKERGEKEEKDSEERAEPAEQQEDQQEQEQEPTPEEPSNHSPRNAPTTALLDTLTSPTLTTHKDDDEITQEIDTILGIPPGTQPLPPTPPLPRDEHKKTMQEELEEGIADLDLTLADDDPCLKGPLSLRNDVSHDQAFLCVLDRKLLDEAERILRRAEVSDDEGDGEKDGEGDGKGDGKGDGDGGEEAAGESRKVSRGEGDLPGIKFKQSTNFGSAFGVIGS